MKVRTELHAGGYMQDAQDQADQFFQNTDQFLNQVAQKTGQLTGTIADKISRTWHCAISA